MRERKALNLLKVGDNVYSLNCLIRSVEDYKKYKNIQKSAYTVIGVRLEESVLVYDLIKRDEFIDFQYGRECDILHKYAYDTPEWYTTDPKEYFDYLNKKLEDYKKELLKEVERIDKILKQKK